MILFVARCGRKAFLDRRVARDERLCRVKRLCAHFAGVVDAHQSSGLPSLLRRELRLGQILAGRQARRLYVTGKRAQRAVEADDQRIDHLSMITRSFLSMRDEPLREGLRRGANQGVKAGQPTLTAAPGTRRKLRLRTSERSDVPCPLPSTDEQKNGHPKAPAISLLWFEA